MPECINKYPLKIAYMRQPGPKNTLKTCIGKSGKMYAVILKKIYT